MQTEQELQNLLYEKMSKEQDNYIEKLKHSKPEKIISSAYEKVMARVSALKVMSRQNMVTHSRVGSPIHEQSRIR